MQIAIKVNESDVIVISNLKSVIGVDNVLNIEVMRDDVSKYTLNRINSFNKDYNFCNIDNNDVYKLKININNNKIEGYCLH